MAAQLRGEPTEIQLKKGRQLPGKSLFVIRFEGIDNRSAAEALVGTSFWCRERSPRRAKFLDLVDWARLTADGPPSAVSDLISGGNDLLEIATTDNRKVLFLSLRRSCQR